MIKDIFSRKFPVDKTEIGRFGRYAVVRGSFANSKGVECRYGLYIPGANATPLTDDGIVLSYSEITLLADLLPALVSSGQIRATTAEDEFNAALPARAAGKKAPTSLW